MFILLFWASSPFVTGFEFGPRTLSVFTLLSLFELVIYFVFNHHLSLNVVLFHFVSCHDFRFFYSCQMSFYLFNNFVINRVIWCLVIICLIVVRVNFSYYSLCRILIFSCVPYLIMSCRDVVF